LQIAIEKGFLTLTEVLLDGGADPMAGNGNALSIAVHSKRTDIVRLLLDRGVPVGTVDFESVCYSCDKELIQLFLDRGADPITGYPLYRGFQHCLRPIISVYKSNIQAMPALQLQADLALCDFAKDGNLRGVSLLLWAGSQAGRADSGRHQSRVRRYLRLGGSGAGGASQCAEANATREISRAIARTAPSNIARLLSENPRVPPDPFA
jgi:hypothetical protein